MPLKQITKTIVSILALTISATAFAKGPSAVSCADLLAPVVPPAASELDYTLSDYEGLYLDIIQDVGAAGQLSVNDQARFYETFLKKKAEFLNLSIYIVRRMVIAKMFDQPMPVSVDQVYSMIMSMGVDPKMYGFTLDANGAPALEVQKPEPSQAASNQEPQAQELNPAQGFIGFIAVKNQGDRDLPDHLKRSIGFGQQSIQRLEAPARKAGQIQLLINAQTKQLIVIDYQNKKKYTFNPQVLAIGMAETDTKIMKLAFVQNAQEWIVSFENTANPEGIIGFAAPGK